MDKKVDLAKKLDHNKKKLSSSTFKEIQGRKWLENYLSKTEPKLVTLLLYSNLDLLKYNNRNGFKGFHVMKKFYLKDSISRKSCYRKFAKKVITKKSSSQSNYIPKGSPRKVVIQSLSPLYLISCDTNSIYSHQIPNLKTMTNIRRAKKLSKKGEKDSFISLLQEKFPESSDLGWPFRQRNNSSDRNSVSKTMPGWPLLKVQAPQTLEKIESQPEIRSKLDLVLNVVKSLLGCEVFEYEDLKSATSQFSSENIIGEGGCSSVYKGNFQSGKTLAVKVLKPYIEAWDDFSLQVKISSTIKHKHIASLLGICLEKGSLISVHEFFPRGSLEDYLHGEKCGFLLPWKVRFNMALSIAEALNYLHNGCSQPIIHRDVKSSNILLTDDFQPQLSDFGLAIWGSKDLLRIDVAGTIGYMSPEYFMYGKISDKVDIYAFGVVLLELVTGKRPIYYSEVSKERESLVKWAEKLLETGNYATIIDPKLKGSFDVDQMKRMVLAAKLCVSQSPRVRPRATQVVRLLNGYDGFEERFNSKILGSNKVVYEDDDDEDSTLGVEYKNFMSFEILDTDSENLSLRSSCSNTTNSSSSVKKGRVTLRDILNQSEDQDD